MSLFNSATPQQIQALARCGSPEMAPLRDLLLDVAARISDQLAKADAPMMVYRYQGELLVINELLQAVKKAPETLSRLS
jgi:hypothetical protein